ncbi:Verrucosidin biosynthesis cluster protein U3 [Exophiala dermatitidis]
MASSSSSEDNFGLRSLRDAHFTGINSPSESSSSGRGKAPAPEGPQFDIIEWFPKYQSCQKYFIDHAQHEPLVQAFASFINILLPFQRQPHPVFYTTGSSSGKSRLDKKDVSSSRTATSESASAAAAAKAAASAISLVPYVRRLVVTGMDVPQVLHGFFGDDWKAGVGPQHEQERRNYLFAAKSGGWASVKRDYDMLPLETVPFMRPLYNPTDDELQAAERTWSEWLALEDWMVGPRAPPDE